MARGIVRDGALTMDRVTVVVEVRRPVEGAERCGHPAVALVDDREVTGRRDRLVGRPVGARVGVTTTRRGVEDAADVPADAVEQDLMSEVDLDAGRRRERV